MGGGYKQKTPLKETESPKESPYVFLSVISLNIEQSNQIYIINDGTLSSSIGSIATKHMIERVRLRFARNSFLINHFSTRFIY